MRVNQFWKNAIITPPKAFDEKRADLSMEALRVKEPVLRSLLLSTFSHSAYLARIALAHPRWVEEIFSKTPQASLKNIGKLISSAYKKDQASFMALLRMQKKFYALLVALCDIGNIWDLEEVMSANSFFADQCVCATQSHLTYHSKGRFPLIILAMGKYGAGELNHSSDIDLILFYQPSPKEASLKEGFDNHRAEYIKIAQNFVAILQKQTADGYVFRVDLSLRPDPGATPIIISLSAARHYYENVGQNWERAAFIKARFVAGESPQSDEFLEEMKHFIWRKYLDFAVLEDIHAMKRQAHSLIGWDEAHLALDGRDIKRASGGIRDIEMFVQSQQLIAGGRDHLLRRKNTMKMLARLAARGWISKTTASELIQAYWFLRHVEHRLQMVNDAQTHKLPNDKTDWEHIALFSGFKTIAAFQKKLHHHMEKVRAHYKELFHLSPSLGAKTGALVFTGGENDPETIESLRQMGYRHPESVAPMIRAWHRGRMASTRSQRAREALTALTPFVLEMMAKTSDPNVSLARFDDLLKHLPMGVQFFALLQANPYLVELLALICGAAPRLVDAMAREPLLIEAVFSDNLDENNGSNDGNDGGRKPDELAFILAQEKNYEDLLNRARLFVRERQFMIGVKILKHQIEGLDAAREFSDLAQNTLICLQKQVEAEFAQTHGVVSGGAMAILAAGSLGAREMTSLSDLDMLFIYHSDDLDQISDGAKPLPARFYYIQLAQKLVHALTVPMESGILYEVDMRLRPSGRVGPVAIALESFIDYQKHKAWIWEHMALTRMRVISGDEVLQKKITDAMHAIIKRPRQKAELQKEIGAMRWQLLDAHKKDSGIWNLSVAKGGLIDVEFICQYMVLLHAHLYKGVFSTHTIDICDEISQAGFADLSAILDAERFFKTLAQPLHLSLGRVGDEALIAPSLRDLLVKTIKVKNFDQVRDRLLSHYAIVNDVFADLIGFDEKNPPNLPK